MYQKMLSVIGLICSAFVIGVFPMVLPENMGTEYPKIWMIRMIILIVNVGAPWTQRRQVPDIRDRVIASAIIMVAFIAGDLFAGHPLRFI